MFRDTLLESSPAGRKGKRWPMAAAFTLEVAVAGLLIVLPLLSSGILPVSAHPPLIAPLSDMRIATRDQAESHPRSGGPRYPVDRVVVVLGNTCSYTCFTNRKPSRNDADEAQPWEPSIGNAGPGPTFEVSHAQKPTLAKPVPVSEISLGQLIHRVEPIYPKMAIITHIEGRVELHAIIAKDGSVRSLEVMRGHPLLANAAMASSWRWKPSSP